jgi:ABC-type transporter MlaC component
MESAPARPRKLDHSRDQAALSDPYESNGRSGNGNSTRLRDRLCQIIRQHKLDAERVKSYAIEFCGAKTLREASREQVEAFVTHLANSIEKDRNALLSQLNSYAPQKEGAA